MPKIFHHRLLDESSGAAAVELALVFPLLLTILFGIIAYGGYFWTAHELQQIANDAARAAMAGLDADERQALAASAFNQEVGGYGNLKAQAARITLTESGETLNLTITYDASASAFWAFRAWLPLPSSVVVRSAVVRQGGY